MEAKYCSKCGLLKPISEFYKDRTKKSGYKSQCKTCLDTPSRREYVKRYREEHLAYYREKHAEYRSRNREKLKQQSKEYRIKNPNATKEYYERNKERIKERSRDYHQSEQGKETRRKYKKSEKYKVMKTRNRLKRRVQVINGDNDITLSKLFNRDKGICKLCGGLCDWNDITYTETGATVGNNYPSLDHIIPVSKGGSHTWDNVQLAHFYCNSYKSDRVA